MRLGSAALVVSVCAALAVGLSLAISATAEEPETPPQVASVVWDERPADVAELAADSNVLVEARVTGIEDGPGLVDPSDEADTAIPTQRISFESIEVLDGQIPSTFKLFKTGSEEIVLEGDPAYDIGEKYVLFLQPQGEPGTYLPAAPDGRLALDAQGEADPVIAGPVAQELEGLTPEQIQQESSE